MNFCVRHYEEPVADNCRTCRNDFCSRCLVYAFGPKKPPYCVGCALTASGVRANRQQIVAHHAPEPRKLTRAERKAEKAARKQAAKLAKTHGPTPEPMPAPAPPPPPPAAHEPLFDGPAHEPTTYAGQADQRELYEQSA